MLSVISDSENLMIFATNVKSNRMEINVDLLLANYDENFNLKLTILQKEFDNSIIQSNQNFKLKIYSVANFKFFYNSPKSNPTRGMYKPGTMLLTRYSESEDEEGSIISSYIISNVPNAVFAKSNMDLRRQKEILKRLQSIYDIEVWDEIVLLKGRIVKLFSQTIEKKFSFWHTRMRDDAGAYSYSYDFPDEQGEEYEMRIVDLYSEENYYGDAFLMPHSSKNIIFLGKNGKLILKRINPPRLVIKTQENIKNLKKQGVKFSIGAYDELGEYWNMRDMSFEITKKGGLIELQEQEIFIFNTFKNFESIFHLPRLKLGNPLNMELELYPKKSGIKLESMNGMMIDFQGVNKLSNDDIQELQIIDDTRFMIKMKKDFNYSLYKCKSLIFNQECKLSANRIMSLNSTLESVHYSQEMNEIFSLLKFDDFKYGILRINPESESLYPNLSFIYNYEILDGRFFDGKFWFIGRNLNEKQINLFEVRNSKLTSRIQLRVLSQYTFDKVDLSFKKSSQLQRPKI